MRHDAHLSARSEAVRDTPGGIRGLRASKRKVSARASNALMCISLDCT